ncbi:protein CNPPD1-like [Montipora foliosa]|uniref:protein CNPPD1-like n=1 Tax=Montipora foliosa TaxID=591990 RepID=UPI0035F148C8
MGIETFEDMSMSEHVEFRDRIRRTLYYGQYSDRSLPSLAVTDVAVDVLSSAAPTKGKHLETSYAMTVSRRAKISPCTLMMGVLYSERLRLKNPDYLKRISSSDLFLISVMVASKYLYDEGEDEEVFNDDWAQAGSKTVNEVNKLEMEFLASIDWSLFISNEDFLDFVNKVESRVAINQGLCRGWFTYADLCTLLDNSRFLQIMNTVRIDVLKVICACTVAYVLSVSLALSVSMLAHHYRLPSEHVTPLETAEPICGLHMNQEMQNKSWVTVGEKSLKESLFVDTMGFVEKIGMQFGLEETKTGIQASCPSDCSTVEHKNVLGTSEIMTFKYSPGLSGNPSCLVTEITLQRAHHFQLPLFSPLSRDSLEKSFYHNNFVFSNFSQGGRNSNHRLSCIYVA